MFYNGPLDMDTEVGDTEGDPTNPLFQFGEKPPAPPALPSLSPSSPPFSPRARPQLRVQGPPGRRGRGQRGGQAMAQMFEDPAVVRTVEGRPSLQVITTIARSVVSSRKKMFLNWMYYLNLSNKTRFILQNMSSFNHFILRSLVCTLPFVISSELRQRYSGCWERLLLG